MHQLKSQRLMMKIPYLRWIVAFALGMAAILNYVDRNVLGLLAPTIQKDLAITDEQYATVINFFLVAYTLSYLVSGRIVDKLGVRVSMALFVAWWSISNALTGLAHSLRSLSAYRFMLGLGEAGCWTVSPKAVSEWFPPAERGIAIGLYSVGGAVGATIAPLLVGIVATRYGWRWVFAVTPMFAGLWLLFWLWLYKKPMDHPRLTPKERDYLSANLEPAAAEPPISEAERWGLVLRRPEVWRLMLARLLTDPAWYFYQFWMPKYLHTARGLDQAGLSILWIIFLAADAGFLLGGFLSGRLIQRGGTPARSRLNIMLVSAAVAPLSLAVPFLPSLAAAIIFCMAIACALTSWLSNLTSLVVDLIPKTILGTAFGVVACGSAVGGILMNEAVGWLVTNRSYRDCFVIMAVLHPLAYLLLRGLGKHSQQTPVQSQAQPAS
ncbi:MAG TPA: MFS transporter [Candidatus Methylacidiphilales bacterium]|nr:MFS transporter [Candidatus Methylacidiphilales bacterium]